MLFIIHDDEEELRAREALDVIRRIRACRPLPTRPDIQDTPWVKTAWPHEWYL